MGKQWKQWLTLFLGAPKSLQVVIAAMKLKTLAPWKESYDQPKELTHLKRPWCWERLRAGREGDGRGWDGWMVSWTQWTWVWVDSGSWWWTGRPGMLRFMGSQRVRHDWVTELNWTEFLWCKYSYQDWKSNITDLWLGKRFTQSVLKSWFNPTSTCHLYSKKE